MKGELFIGEDLKTDTAVVCDICVVGSGAGGAVLAAGLVEKGFKVVMLEEGGYFARDNFKLNEGDAYFNLYQDRGTRGTADLAVTILQGRSVGGSTTVNWTTCFRTPKRILKLWEERFGVEGLSYDTLVPHFEAVEKRLGIQEWPLGRVNRNNQILVEGCQTLGWEVNALRRNVRGCADSGYCGMGCPIGAKQAMHRTYIQDALDGGLTVFSDVKVSRLEWEGRRVKKVVGEVLDRSTGRSTEKRVLVEAKVFVSSCGAINGPALLLRSGLDGNGRVGKRTMLHPVVALPGIYDDVIDPYYGAPQSVSSHQFIDRGSDKVGFFLEAAPVHPVLGSLGFSAFGDSQGRLMQALPHTGVLLSLAADGVLPHDEGGTVSLRADGRIRVDYPIGEHLKECFLEAHQKMAELELAAGVREAISLHVDSVVVRSKNDLEQLRQAEYGALKHAVFSAHQMGGCAMGENSETSVVDSNLRYRGLDNLFVVDGSVFPTSLGVNPSETIYALANWATDGVASRV